jgi:hypothetical protein
MNMKKLSKIIVVGIFGLVLVAPYVMASATFAENRMLLIAGKTSCKKGNKSVGDYKILSKSDENQIDMHALKVDCLGSEGSLFNTYVNKDKSNVMFIKISDTSITVDTYMSLQTVKDTFPISGKK